MTSMSLNRVTVALDRDRPLTRNSCADLVCLSTRRAGSRNAFLCGGDSIQNARVRCDKSAVNAVPTLDLGRDVRVVGDGGKIVPG